MGHGNGVFVAEILVAAKRTLGRP